MQTRAPKITEKLTKAILVRLTESDHNRLLAAAREGNQEPVDIIRDAALVEVGRRELEVQRKELQRLSAAGIDLKSIVDYAIGRKLAEEAQANLPGMFSSTDGGGGRK